MPVLPPRPFIYPITDRKLSGDLPIGKIVRALCEGGAKIIQLREKGITTRQFWEVATEAVEVAHNRGAKLIVNDRVDIALLTGADGVHLGEDDLPADTARRILGAEKIIGLSCHSVNDVGRAHELPVDYIAVGPVYPTDTKALRYPVVGTDLITRARELTTKPLVAIGGISASNAADVMAAGADGIAVISAVMAPGEVESRTAALLKAIRSGR